MSNKPPIPDDHPIREIWQFNRLDINGLIELARTGDRDAAKTLMKRFVYMKDREAADKSCGVTRVDQRSIEYKELLEGYIAECVRLSLRSDDANIGFKLSRENKNRPGATYLEKEVQYHIGYRVAVLIDELPSKSKAYQLAAMEFNVSASQARHCYEKFMKLD